MTSARRNVARLARACTVLCLMLCAGLASAQNAIQLENAKTAGVSGQWFITDAGYAANQEIEGFASATSVNRGDSINLYVQTKSTDASYTINVFRVGWYGGAGGRLVAGPVTRTRTAQPACPMTDPDTRLVECSWTDPYVLSTGSDWTSGVYLAKLTGASSGKSSYVIFVVRDDARAANILFQTAVTTYAAYNNWGGYDFYPTDSAGGTSAQKVSFDRPYSLPQRHQNGKGAGDFFAWEINMLRFVEREGFDVKYSTNIDTHTSPARLLSQRMFMSVGHDEYYTKEMYDAVQAARDAGVHLGFFGANNIYWQVRLESGTGNRANRVVVGYKYDADPIMASDPSRATYTWRDTARADINRPEAALMGVMYDYNTVRGDIVIDDCPAWICAGANVTRGDVLPGLLGYEVDRVGPASPAGVTALASSPYDACLDAPCSAVERRYANVSFYAAASGAGVFASGSMQWTWGLDSFSPGTRVDKDDQHADLTSAAAQAITRNVLNRFSSAARNFPPHISSDPLVSAAAGATYLYQVAASDPDNDAITLSLVLAPAGMTISATGEVRWTPGLAQIGSHAVSIRVTDTGGLTETQSFTLTVRDNAPPVITSAPYTAGRVDSLYAYPVVASDPDGNPITFSLPVAPTGMTISASGVISWIPASTQGGLQNVTVRATDSFGLAVNQVFTILVAPVNVPPRFTSHPPLTARLGGMWIYDADAVDPNNEPVFYSLLQAPPRMSIDAASGVIIWSVSGISAGPVQIAVRAADAEGLSVVQTFTVTVSGSGGLFGDASSGSATVSGSTGGSGGSAAGTASASTGGTDAGGGGGGCALGGPGPFDPALPLMAMIGLAGIAMRTRRRAHRSDIPPAEDPAHDPGQTVRRVGNGPVTAPSDVHVRTDQHTA